MRVFSCKYSRTLTLLLLCCSTALFAGQSSVIVSKRIKHPPKIDGKLDDECWRKSGKTVSFTVITGEKYDKFGEMMLGEKKFLKNASTVQVCNDDENIYFFFTKK